MKSGLADQITVTAGIDRQESGLGDKATTQVRKPARSHSFSCCLCLTCLNNRAGVSSMKESNMIDRHMAYVVTLNQDTREDDAQAIINALVMIKGVLSVEQVKAEPMGMAVSSRVRHEVINKLMELIK